LILKILYEYKGLCHPLAIQIENGLGIHQCRYINNKTINNKTITTEYFSKLNYLEKNKILLNSLDKSKHFVRNNLSCSICKYNVNYSSNKSITYYTTETIYYSWCQTLYNIQRRFGEKFEAFICISCLDVIDITQDYNRISP